MKHRVKVLELLFEWEEAWPLSFPGEKRWEKSCFPSVTYIGLLQVLAEVLICKQQTELDLRIKKIWNDKCRIESIVAGGCQLRLGTNPLGLGVPWLPPSGRVRTVLVGRADGWPQGVHGTEVVMWYRVHTASNYNLNKLSMEGGGGLESSFINPLKLCSQCFKKVYVLLWIAIMMTNAGAQRVGDHSLFSRQCFTRTIQSNNPRIFKIKWMRKMKCKTLDKDKLCNKSCLRFSYCVLWLCCLMKQTFLVLSIPFCALIGSFNSS